MKRVLTHVIAAVFAFCLFTLLPAWAMSETNAFSDGRQEITDINRAEDSSVRTDFKSGAINTFIAADQTNDSDRLPRVRFTPEDDRPPLVMPILDTALILNKPGLMMTDVVNINDHEKPGLKESAVLQRPDLPPNCRSPRNRPEPGKSEPDREPLLPDIVIEL